ncbi:hypothetical protein H4219_004646 [Mycoemilia scoparia]|uniref:protein-histidine N-methyltransferase n=1 Tax=Mycoemilia scoparia TaxID=417184 RepID=A0A9W8DMI4_9FUNG|nr:hypothetical protein H4219_004646 [Mycoemilia scoparia]
MSFKFNFPVDDADRSSVDNDIFNSPDPENNSGANTNKNSQDNLFNAFSNSTNDQSASQLYQAPFSEVALEIPKVSAFEVDKICYGGNQNEFQKIIYKRQLADVQFQLAEEDTMNEISNQDEQQQGGGDEDVGVKKALMTEGKGASDLIAGVYEGGLKTWECSLDLLDYLTQRYPQLTSPSNSGNKQIQVLEIGCGSGLPTLHILKQSYENSNSSNGTKSNSGGRIHFQDYNRDVLRLVTIPNVLLNTVLTKSFENTTTSTNDDGENILSVDLDEIRGKLLVDNGIISQEEMEAKIREESDPEDDDDDDNDEDSEDDDSVEGINNKMTFLELSDQDTVTADSILTKSLTDTTNLDIRFFGGDWENVSHELQQRGYVYDLVLTSETIYNVESFSKLYNLIRTTLKRNSDSSSVVDKPVALVAAKTMYFGLTGSTLSFKNWIVENHGNEMDIETVWKSSGSMGREILQLSWNTSNN